MLFQETPIPGAYLINPEPHYDARGFFARTWCEREVQLKGLDPALKQCSLSYNHRYGTLRGMHLQLPPFAETKLVRCIRGAVYDVIVDLRVGSPKYLHWYGVELSDENYTALYVPHGLAHGFITLYDETEIFYQMSEFYAPDYAVGVRWNDSRINIQWPVEVRVISAKDRTLPDYDPDRFVGIRYENHFNQDSNCNQAKQAALP